jgi:hypothetical protein
MLDSQSPPGLPFSFLGLGVISFCVALIFTVTGKALVRFQGLVDRAEDPKTFWWTVAVLYLTAVVSLAVWRVVGH